MVAVPIAARIALAIAITRRFGTGLAVAPRPILASVRAIATPAIPVSPVPAITLATS
jgi:hypothetical protein